MEGHTLIIPSEHATSSRTVDEATWTEMRNFKKSLILMFRAQVQAAASTMLAFLVAQSTHRLPALGPCSRHISCPDCRSTLQAQPAQLIPVGSGGVDARITPTGFIITCQVPVGRGPVENVSQVLAQQALKLCHGFLSLYQGNGTVWLWFSSKHTSRCECNVPLQIHLHVPVPIESSQSQTLYQGPTSSDLPSRAPEHEAVDLLQIWPSPKQTLTSSVRCAC